MGNQRRPYSQRTPKQVAATPHIRQVRSRPRTRYRTRAAWPEGDSGWGRGAVSPTKADRPRGRGGASREGASGEGRGTLAGREARAGLGAPGTHTAESARQRVTSRGSRQLLAAPTGPLRKGATPVEVGKPGKRPLPPTPTPSSAPRLPSVLRRLQPPLWATLALSRAPHLRWGSRAPPGSCLILSPGTLYNPSGSLLIFPSGALICLPKPSPQECSPFRRLPSLLPLPRDPHFPLELCTPTGLPDPSIEPSLPGGSLFCLGSRDWSSFSS